MQAVDVLALVSFLGDGGSCIYSLFIKKLGGLNAKI